MMRHIISTFAFVAPFVMVVAIIIGWQHTNLGVPAPDYPDNPVVVKSPSHEEMVMSLDKEYKDYLATLVEAE